MVMDKLFFLHTTRCNTHPTKKHQHGPSTEWCHRRACDDCVILDIRSSELDKINQLSKVEP